MQLTHITAKEIGDAHPARRLHAYWLANRNDAGVMPRAAFNPLHLPDVMRWVMILERVGPLIAAHYRYRLCGSGCVQITSHDYTGQLLGFGIEPGAAADRRREFFDVLTSCQPLFSVTQLPVEGREFIQVNRAVFPVQDDEGRDQVFVVLAPVDEVCKAPGGAAAA